MSKLGLLLPEVRGPHLFPSSTSGAMLHSSWRGNGEASTLPQLRAELPPRFNDQLKIIQLVDGKHTSGVVLVQDLHCASQAVLLGLQACAPRGMFRYTLGAVQSPAEGQAKC